jgi:hypothetical protein
MRPARQRPVRARWPRSGIAHSRRRPRQSWASRICGNARGKGDGNRIKRMSFSIRFGWEHQWTDEEAVRSSMRDEGSNSNERRPSKHGANTPDATHAFSITHGSFELPCTCFITSSTAGDSWKLAAAAECAPAAATAAVRFEISDTGLCAGTAAAAGDEQRGATTRLFDKGCEESRMMRNILTSRETTGFRAADHETEG